MAPVSGTRADTRRLYDRIAPVYDLIETPFERRAHRAGIDLLGVRAGEDVLEIGFGTGHTLLALARLVGGDGRVAGVDLSARMCAVTKRRLQRAHPAAPTVLVHGDATALPIAANGLAGVLLSFVLELMPAGEIPVVLGECARVLQPDGRLVVISLVSTAPPTAMTRLYLRLRRWLPQLLDCRPIPLTDVLSRAGFRVRAERRLSVFGLPAAAVLAEVGD